MIPAGQSSELMESMTAMTEHSVADRAHLDMLDPAVADAIVASVRSGTASGAVFPMSADPDELFRAAVADAITAIEARGPLVADFLRLGPSEYDGPIPADCASTRLSDEACALAITLIHAHAINCFKGALAELIAVSPCSELTRTLLSEKILTEPARVYVGDAARPVSTRGSVSKGADLHVLLGTGKRLQLAAVAEVKSYPASPERLRGQLVAHAGRALRGLHIVGQEGPAAIIPEVPAGGPVLVSIASAGWRLSRKFWFTDDGGRVLLHMEPLPRIPAHVTRQVSGTHWHVTLGWSQEALAAQAYALTYWYLEQLGAQLFSGDGESSWPEMSGEEAGVNSAKQSLYYAIRRCPDPRSEQRAIALYNAYGFGYALGTSFRDSAGRRQMLWPEHLREILAAGRTREGFRLLS